MSHIFIGIDVSKFKHDVYAYNQVTGEVLISNLTINNNLDGFSTLFNKISNWPLDDVIVGMEETGHYHQNLADFLHRKHVPVGLINSLQTSRLRQTSVRKTKTDKIDCRVITQALNLGLHHLYEPQKDALDDLKSLSRLRHYLVGQRSQLKNKLIKSLDVVFPEYHKFFSSIHSKTSYTLLLECASAFEIAKVRVDHLQNILDTHQSRYDAQTLKDLAKASIGTYSMSAVMEIQSYIHLINGLSSQIKTVEENLEQLYDSSQSTIDSIPGISTVLASMIVGEVGDINRFDSPKKLLAYAGLDPSVHQSGQYEANQSSMSKRGSKYLRYALMKAASITYRHDATFNDYYTRKKAQGKHHLVVLGHCSKKLVNIIYKLMKSNETYNPSL